MFLVGLFFVFFSSSVKELRSKSTSTQTCLPAFLPSCPSVIVSAHSQFEVDAGSHHHFYTHCLWLYTFFFSLHLFFFFSFHSVTTHSHTRMYACTHRHSGALSPAPGPRATYTQPCTSGSCSLISSSHTHSGSVITSGGPVRHECYPVDNNHSRGKGSDPIPYLLTAPRPPPGARVALKKLAR